MCKICWHKIVFGLQITAVKTGSFLHLSGKESVQTLCETEDPASVCVNTLTPSHTAEVIDQSKPGLIVSPYFQHHQLNQWSGTFWSRRETENECVRVHTHTNLLKKKVKDIKCVNNIVKMLQTRVTFCLILIHTVLLKLSVCVRIKGYAAKKQK